ncbi:hypothetical protein EZS27_007428 [termite gut metagenome]|uniref:LamG-like jellyroll fold domain-containing protein n=1 Tax=termite gut metagenome TaxID=433724 RepID=A0A5J4SFM9_9ZZZZ
MKQILVYVSLFCIGLMLSCTNAIEFENRVYIAGTEESDTRQLIVDGVPSEVAFMATLTDLVDEVIEVEIAADNGLIEAYNRKNHKNYKPMPGGSFNLSASVLRIEPQNLRSNPAKVVITDDSAFEEGTSYLMPVTITKVKGGVKLLDASKTVYFTILKTIVTKACNLRGSLYFRVDFSKNGDESLTALPAATMETRFYCTATMSGNPWISSIMGLEENWLIRMGDARNIPDNSVQTAGSGSNATAPNPTPLGEWHHLAAVFENKTVKLYIDGNLEAQTPHPGSSSFDGKPKSTPGCINLMAMYGDPSFSIGISANATARRWNGYFSEMRVWKKALTRADIVNNMCYVDPASPGLVAYWRFDGSTTEEDGKTVILDHTGNGYNAVPSATIAANNWVENVKCP